MPDAEGFQERLASALETKRQFLEQKALPRLQESFHGFLNLYESLYGILLRKSLLQEDPYKYEQKISEVTVPAREAIQDSQKDEELSQRLSDFHRQLEFLNTYYQFTLDFLTLERLRRVIGLVQYVNWLHLVETAPDDTTATLAELITKVRLGTDSTATGILANALPQLEQQVRQILTLLKEVLGFQRQAYKLELRRRIVSARRRSLAGVYAEAPEQAYAQIKSQFQGEMRGEPFYRDLVLELLEEEFSEDSGRLQELALARLAVPEEKPQRQTQAPDYRAVLLEAVRLMLPAGVHLGEALRKVEANQQLLQGRRRLGGRVRRWLRRALRSRSSEQLISLRYFDSVSSTTRVDKLNLQRFMVEMRKRITLFSALSTVGSAGHQKLQAAAEQTLLEFLTRNLGELQLAHRRLEGLSDMQRETAPAAERQRLKGIRIELSGLKNCIIRANRRRYDYVARKEEEAQLRKLGAEQAGA
jgi:hypothetical protein